MRRFFREVYMDSVFPVVNSAELPPYIWGNDEREKVGILSSQFQNIAISILFSVALCFPKLEFLSREGNRSISTSPVEKQCLYR